MFVNEIRLMYVPNNTHAAYSLQIFKSQHKTHFFTSLCE